MILVAPPNEWVGPAGRTIPELAHALGRSLKVSPDMARPILALRLARPEDGDAILREIARLTLGEWKPAPDGTLTLVQNPAARNRVRAARERAFRERWAAIVEERRRRIDPAPNWRTLADAVPTVITAYARDRNDAKAKAFEAKTPQKRMWNRIVASLPLADLVKAGSGAYSDRGGTVVRTLPGTALTALRDYRKEAEIWRTERSRLPIVPRRNEYEHVVEPPGSALAIMSSEVLGNAEPPPTFARVVLSWEARFGGILFELRYFDARGSQTRGGLESVRPLDEPPERPRGRPSRPYPKVVLSQLIDCDALDWPSGVEPTRQEIAAGRDVLRNDPQVYAALPYLAEAERRGRSLVVPLPDVTPRQESARYDLLDEKDVERLGLAEGDGVLTSVGELVSPSEEAIDRTALAEALVNARRETSNLLARARWAWATRNLDADATAVRWPFTARLGLPTTDRVDPASWLPILGGLTDAQRARGLHGGLALSSLSPELRERVRRIVYDPEAAESQDRSALATPALRWPDGFPDGRLTLRKRREYFLLGKGGIGSLDPDDFARARTVAASPADHEGEVVADVTRVRAGLREWTTLEIRIEDRTWSGEMEEVLRLDPPVPPDKLPTPWLRWLDSARPTLTSRRPPPAKL